ncbi:hypothetical protein D3C86_2122770 [compost metagenome]
MVEQGLRHLVLVLRDEAVDLRAERVDAGLFPLARRQELHLVDLRRPVFDRAGKVHHRELFRPKSRALE